MFTHSTDRPSCVISLTTRTFEVICNWPFKYFRWSILSGFEIWSSIEVSYCHYYPFYVTKFWQLTLNDCRVFSLRLVIQRILYFQGMKLVKCIYCLYGIWRSYYHWRWGPKSRESLMVCPEQKTNRLRQCKSREEASQQVQIIENTFRFLFLFKAIENLVHP